jgi:hypothetical protein
MRLGRLINRLQDEITEARGEVENFANQPAVPAA